MKSFLEVQQIHTDKILESNKIAADAQRVRLLGAIKTTYGISSFKSLSESEKAIYKRKINEMWNPITGLNSKGKMFILEAELYEPYKFNSMLLPAGIYNYIEKCGINLDKLYMISNSEDEVSDINRKANDQEKKFNKLVNWFSLMKLGQYSNNKYQLGKDIVYYFEYKGHKFVRWHKNGGNELLFMDGDGAEYLYNLYTKIGEKKNDK